MKRYGFCRCVTAAVLAVCMCVSMCSCAMRKYDPERDYVSPLTESEDQAESSYDVTESSEIEEGSDTSTESKESSSKESSSKVSSSKASSSKATSSKASSSKASSSKASSSKASSSKAASSRTATNRVVTYVSQPGDDEEEENASSQTTSSEQTSSSEPKPEPQSEPEQPSEPEENRPSVVDGRKLVVIDAGHQSSANLGTEPIGPGAYESKIKVSGGTQGVATGIPEYQLTLDLALVLQPILEDRGYEVVQIRTSNDVDISNVERAQIANDLGADVFIRLHANGSENSATSGAMTLCQTQNNPYNGDLYNESRLLSGYILDELVSSTGCRKEYVWETDTMTGINWARVPVSIVEVGYMTNPAEDRLLAQDDYREKICIGIANGIDLYMNEIGEY